MALDCFRTAEIRMERLKVSQTMSALACSQHLKQPGASLPTADFPVLTPFMSARSPEMFD